MTEQTEATKVTGQLNPDQLREERHRQHEERVRERTTKIITSGNPSFSEHRPYEEEVVRKNTKTISNTNVPVGYKYSERPNMPPSPSRIQRGKTVR